MLRLHGVNEMAIDGAILQEEAQRGGQPRS